MKQRRFTDSHCALQGNFLEYENIVGEPLRMGTKLGVSMPTLHVVYHILKAFQWRTAEARNAPKVDGVQASDLSG